MIGKCRVCGCTQEDCRNCIERTGHPCSWAEPDLCSACVIDKEDPLYKLYLQVFGLEEEVQVKRFVDWSETMVHEYKAVKAVEEVVNHSDFIAWATDNLPIKTERIVEENQAVSSEPVPDAYQEYLEKRNSSSITFTEMKFFEQLKLTGKDVHLSIDIKEKNGKYTVMVLPKASDASRIMPIVVTGTADELDEGFFKKVGPQLIETGLQLQGLEEHRKSVEDATKSNDKKSTPAASSEKQTEKKGPAAAAAKKNAAKKSAKKETSKKEEVKTEETPKVVEQALF